MFDLCVAISIADIVNALLIRHHTPYMSVYAIMYTVLLFTTYTVTLFRFTWIHKLFGLFYGLTS